MFVSFLAACFFCKWLWNASSNSQASLLHFQNRFCYRVSDVNCTHSLQFRTKKKRHVKSFYSLISRCVLSFNLHVCSRVLDICKFSYEIYNLPITKIIIRCNLHITKIISSTWRSNNIRQPLNWAGWYSNRSLYFCEAMTDATWRPGYRHINAY
jgi:hypothetical protein